MYHSVFWWLYAPMSFFHAVTVNLSWVVKFSILSFNFSMAKVDSQTLLAGWHLCGTVSLREIDGPQRMKPTDISDLLNSEAPSSGQNFIFLMLAC